MITETKRIGKYLLIEKNINGKTYIKNKKDEILGEIFFYAKWNQYVYEGEICTFYSWDCMMDISKCLQELNNE